MTTESVLRVASPVPADVPRAMYPVPKDLVDLGERLGPAAAMRRFDRAVAAAIAGGVVLGGGAACGRAYAGEVPYPLLWAAVVVVVGLLLIGAGLVLAWRWRTAGGQVPDVRW
jgi:protein-S-isoprenylcysteine O-methyltransferase Ste14